MQYTYTYGPGQAIEAGTYIVKLEKVVNIVPGNGELAEVGPPGNGELANVGPGRELADVGPGRELANVGPGRELAEVGPPGNGELANVGPGENNEQAEEGDEEAKENNNANVETMGGGKRKTKMNKKAKSKGMKKSKGTRKLSGYMKFAQEVRPQILKNNPSLKSDIIGVGRKIGEMWRGLSAAEKARY